MKDLFLIVVVCAGALGCGGGSPTDGGADVPPGPTPIPVEELCMRAAIVFCTANAECCTVAEERYASIDACTAEQEMLCNEAARGIFVVESVEEGRLLYSQARGRSAIDRLHSAGQACMPARYVEQLAMAFTGTLAEGAACELRECESGLGCAGGTCTAVKSAGAACSDTDPCLADDLFCAEDGTCADKLATGADCTTHDQCESGACTSGICGNFHVDEAYCVTLGSSTRRAFARR